VWPAGGDSKPGTARPQRQLSCSLSLFRDRLARLCCRRKPETGGAHLCVWGRSGHPGHPQRRRAGARAPRGIAPTPRPPRTPSPIPAMRAYLALGLGRRRRLGPRRRAAASAETRAIGHGPRLGRASRRRAARRGSGLRPPRRLSAAQTGAREVLEGRDRSRRRRRRASPAPLTGGSARGAAVTLTSQDGSRSCSLAGAGIGLRELNAAPGACQGRPRIIKGAASRSGGVASS
jgi:hypothetical protein